MTFLRKLLSGSDGSSLPEQETEAYPTGTLADTQFRLRVESVLDKVRPALRADGGDIELVDIVGHSAKVRLTGACVGCASASMTLRLGIETRLKQDIPEFEDLIPVV
jgi:Fe-S cluster biogenesis protein NfuA